MRRQTLAGLCIAVALLIGSGLTFIGLRLPFGLSPFAIGLLLIPVLIVPLTILNDRLLNVKGRDLDREERHEIEDADIISLRPREESEADHYRYYDGRK